MIYNLIGEVEARLGEIVTSMDVVNGEDVGLDQRVGPLYINEDCIAVPANADRRLQYYGGFEYIDAAHRIAFGNWVVYLSTDDSERVNDCIAAWKEK